MCLCTCTSVLLGTPLEYSAQIVPDINITSFKVSQGTELKHQPWGLYCKTTTLERTIYTTYLSTLMIPSRYHSGLIGSRTIRQSECWFSVITADSRPGCNPAVAESKYCERVECPQQVVWLCSTSSGEPGGKVTPASQQRRTATGGGRATA